VVSYFLIRDQALSLWSGNTDSKTLDYQRTNPAAAAAAKSLQSCPILCDPIDSSPPGFPRPWDSPGKNTGVGCHFLLQCMKVKSESEVAQLCLTLSDPMDCSLPGSYIHGIFQARVLGWGAIESISLDKSLSPLSLQSHCKNTLFLKYISDVTLSPN